MIALERRNISLEELLEMVWSCAFATVSCAYVFSSILSRFFLFGAIASTMTHGKAEIGPLKRTKNARDFFRSWSDFFRGKSCRSSFANQAFSCKFEGRSQDNPTILCSSGFGLSYLKLTPTKDSSVLTRRRTKHKPRQKRDIFDLYQFHAHVTTAISTIIRRRRVGRQ